MNFAVKIIYLKKHKQKKGQIVYLNELHPIFQVTIEYLDENGDIKPIRIHTVVISTQHSASVTQQQLQQDVMKQVIEVRVKCCY